MPIFALRLGVGGWGEGGGVGGRGRDASKSGLASCSLFFWHLLSFRFRSWCSSWVSLAVLVGGLHLTEFVAVVFVNFFSSSFSLLLWWWLRGGFFFPPSTLAYCFLY